MELADKRMEAAGVHTCGDYVDLFQFIETFYMVDLIQIMAEIALDLKELDDV